MRLLKQANVHLPSVPNGKDISRADKAVCNSAFISWEGQNESEDPQIHKGMIFDTLQELQFFMAEYAVKFYRLFTVVHSDKNLRYDVMCKQGCLWRVWSRHVWSTGKWRVSRVVQSHTCSLATKASTRTMHSKISWASYPWYCSCGQRHLCSFSRWVHIFLLFVPCKVLESLEGKATRHCIALGWLESFIRHGPSGT